MVSLRRVFLINALALAAVVLALLFVARPERWPAPETPPQQGEAAALLRFGETPHHRDDALAHLIREPQNTWSNLAYIAGGAILIGGATTRMARATGLALVGVGLGSFLYHASASRTLRHLDVGAMYWLFLLAGGLSLGRLRSQLQPALERHARIFLAIGLLAAVALTLGRNVRIAGLKPLSLTAATATLAVVMIAALVRVSWRQRTRVVLAGSGASAGLFAVAVICQLGDRPGGWLFAPTSPVQAHAAWHVLSALAFVLAVRALDAPAPALPSAATMRDLGSSQAPARALR